jgi:triacylglycerol lipase
LLFQLVIIMTKHLAILAALAATQACALTADVSQEEGVPIEAMPDGSGGNPISSPSPVTGGTHVGFVLAHGLDGSAGSFDPAIVAALNAAGYAVLRDDVAGIDSVEVRAKQLAPQIDAFMAANQLDHVHIIAHSMGGLDARYLISTLGYASKVKSLTTLSTPHRGSPLADIGLGITHSLTTSQEDAILAIGKLLGEDTDKAALNRALVDLSEAQAPAFNAANPDEPGIVYYSYAGYSSVGGVDNPHADALCAAGSAAIPDPSSLPDALNLTGPIIADGLELRPHDGVVPIDSSMWTGYQGCIPTDHLDITRAGEKDPGDLDLPLVPFYLQIAARVAPL